MGSDATGKLNWTEKIGTDEQKWFRSKADKDGWFSLRSSKSGRLLSGRGQAAAGNFYFFF